MRRSTLVAWIRRHPIIAFLAWLFSIGWSIAFIPVVFETGLPRQLFIVASTVFGLLLPTLLITSLVDGRSGVRQLIARIGKLRLSVGWYAVALLGVPAAALALGTLLFGPAAATPGALVIAVANVLLVQTAIGLLTNNLWEEVAWTGFVQARLQARHGALFAAVIASPFFALQHLPLLADSGAGPMLVIPLVTAIMIPFRALLAWLYNRTGSLFLVGLLHAAGNAAATGSGFGAGLLQRLYVQPNADELHLYAEVLLGLAVIAVTWGRLGLPSRKIQAVHA